MWYDATRTSWYQREAGRSCYGSYGEGALLVGDADVYGYLLDVLEDVVPDALSMLGTSGSIHATAVCQFKLSIDRLRTVRWGCS